MAGNSSQGQNIKALNMGQIIKFGYHKQHYKLHLAFKCK